MLNQMISLWRIPAFVLRATVLAFTFCAATPAGAALFMVDNSADLADAIPGNGVCSEVGGSCTVRAAIEEANAFPGTDSISIPAGSYLLDSPLVVDDSAIINGAGMGITILDGQDATEVLRIRTVEALVCDSAMDRVRSFDIHGQSNGTFISSGSGGLSMPFDLTIRSDGEIYVTGFSSGVHNYEADGAPGSLFTVPAPLGPTSAAFGPAPDFDLFVTEFQPGGGIKRFDRATGALLGTFVAAGSGGLAFPNSLVFFDGDLYVSSAGNDEILRYDGEIGAFISSFVPPGTLSIPRGLVFHEGSLYVASEGNNSIQRYDAVTGGHQGIFVSTGSGGLVDPIDLAFGPNGDLYVLSDGSNQILRYDGATGAFIDIFLNAGPLTVDKPSCLTWRTATGDGPIVSITGLDLANGRASLGNTAGLRVDSGATLTATGISIRDNNSSSFGGGVQNWGNLTLRRAQVMRNALPEGGGGQTSQGGGIFNSGRLTLDRSLVADNYATRGGGVSNVNEGNIDILNSTISGNTANGAGGGIRNVGDGRINIAFATITDNSGNAPGGAGEPNRLGGGIYNSATARISMANTILAGNTDNRSASNADYAPDCYSLTAHHFNSERDNIVGVLNANCDFTDVIFGDDRFIEAGTPASPLDPGLGALLSHGGPTRTHALLAGSPAIDGDVAVTSATYYDCEPHDQRDQPRPIDGDIDGLVRCDIGAFEYQPLDDGDGVPAAVEDGAPNDGDGNADGIPDRLQAAITSLPLATGGGYVTLQTGEGSVLSQVTTSPATGAPPGAVVPHGLVGFTVTATPSATVTLIFPGVEFPAAEPLTSYWKYGATSVEAADHWYEFLYNGTTGATIAGDVVTLHLVDGERGDDDVTVNGLVVEPGGPSISDADSDGIPDSIDPSEIADAVSALGANVFKARGHRHALTAKLSAAEHQISKGNFNQGAKLLFDVTKHLNGCGASADADDWIIDCPAQVLVRADIDGQIGLLVP